MRNALAHSPLDFTDEGSNITGIIFEGRTENSRDGDPPLWRSAFDRAAFSQFLNRLADGVEVARKRQVRREATDPVEES